MKKLAAFLVFLSFDLPVLAAEWQLIKEESTMTFSGLQLGKGFDGRIEHFTAIICFDESDLDGAEVVLDIDLTSITTGIEDRDEILAAAEWLDIAEYPNAVIKTLVHYIRLRLNQYMSGVDSTRC